MEIMENLVFLINAIKLKRNLHAHIEKEFGKDMCQNYESGSIWLRRLWILRTIEGSY